MIAPCSLPRAAARGHSGAEEAAAGGRHDRRDVNGQRAPHGRRHAAQGSHHGVFAHRNPPHVILHHGYREKRVAQRTCLEGLK